ncbi:molybdopterin-binding protein [Paraburkholderia metrosideri]|jgi:molybdenum cofactor synthesis domain-containing protein|uniref:Molybdopterin-binding protein n=1 Tax=Paraburkholderia metrosideri TaxID=580937 RepID=A0ABW9E0Y1_9BURK
MTHSYSLLDKTELTLQPIVLNGANLRQVADTAAAVLGLASDEVYVIDARDDLLTLDILRSEIRAETLVGKSHELLAALGRLPGIIVDDRTRVMSQGILGWIAGDAAEVGAALQASNRIVDEMRANIARRAVVFATGPEVIQHQIVDTNTPLIARLLAAQGVRVTPGGALTDDPDVIAGALREAVTERGFGLVVTTGGVGAEKKDCTIDAVLALDPNAATPYIVKFQAGSGRHLKDGVRIAVGTFGHALLVALPGPNEEVQLAITALCARLHDGLDKHALARAMVEPLRQRLRGGHGSEGSHHGHVAR